MRHAHRAPIHGERSIALRGDRVPNDRRARSRIRTARSSSSCATSRCPAEWSQVACDVLAQKYFRKAGVPARLKSVREGDIPEWLCRHIPDEEALAELAPEQRTVGETKATQVFDRMAGTWTYWGWRGGYFDGEERRPRLLRRDALHARAPDGRRRTRRNGSTPACIGPMASTGRRRATTTSTSSRASWSPRTRPTSIRSRTPASSSRWPTIS